MSTLQEAKQQILKELKKAMGREFSPSLDDLSRPPDSAMGDIAFACFGLAKALKKNPAELAREIAAKVGPKLFIKKIEAQGPYVNFTLDDARFGAAVLAEIEKQKYQYGVSSAGGKAKIMVEYANINTHKMIHIGHLRNFFLGQATINVLRASGQTVIPVYYINDLGMHVASVVWAHQTLHAAEEPAGEDKIAFLGDLYTEAVKKMEESPEVKAEISKVFQVLESGKGPEQKLWKKTRKWSLAYIHDVYHELGLEIQKKYYESDLIKPTRKIIEGLIKKGIVVHSDGAWIVDLKDQGLGVNLLVKSDKTLLYNAKDLALALRKEKDFHPTRSVYVVDARQSHALAQLFATLKRMEFRHELVHLSYEFVTLADAAMSSRRGNILRYEVFRDAMIELALAETKKRHADWPQQKIEKVARAIAFAGMRFSMLKQDSEKKIVFDMEEALSFDGFTGPYLLYSFARIESLMRKAPFVPVATFTHTPEPVEHRLLTLLARYPEVVFEAGQKLAVAPLAQYLFEVAHTFAELYETVPILSSPREVGVERLGLAAAAARVLENGLGLLGIETVPEM